jgi:hypothetical protein
MDLDQILKIAIRVDQVPCFSGIYYLIKDNVIVYVGQSTNVIARIAAHLAVREKVFDSYSFVQIPAEELNHMEAKEIIRHRPIYNVGGLPCNTQYKSMEQLKKITGLSAIEIKHFARDNNILPVSLNGLSYYSVNEFESETA